MSHTPTCIWNGQHDRQGGYRLAYFSGLLGALARLQGAESVEAVLAAPGLGSSLSPLDEIGAWESEMLVNEAARRLGGVKVLAALCLDPKDCFFRRAVEEALPGFPSVEAFVRTCRLAQTHGTWSLRSEREKGRVYLRYSGPPSDAGEAHAAYRQALVRCLARMLSRDLRRPVQLLSSEPGEAGQQVFILSGIEASAVSLRLLAAVGALSVAAVVWGGAVAWALLGLLGGLTGLAVWERLFRRGPGSQRDDENLRFPDEQTAICEIHFLGAGRLMAYWSVEGRLRYINRPLARLLGFSQSADAETLTRQWVQKLGFKPGGGRREVSGIDGQTWHLELAERSVVDLEGRPLGTLVVLSQAEKEWNSEDEAVSKKALFESLIDNGLVAILLLDHENRIVFASNNFERLFGYQAANLLQQNVLSLFLSQDRGEVLKAIADSAAVCSVHLRLQTGEQLRWVHARFENRRDDPVLGGILVQLRDVTASQEREAALRETQESLRLSEEYYRMMIEGSLDLVAVLDQRLRVVYVNGAVEELLGRKPASLIGRDVRGLLDPEDLSAAVGAVARLKKEGGWTQAQLHLMHAGGERRLFSLRGRSAVDPDGRTVFLVGGRDVTNEVRLQAALVREERLQAVGQLAGGLAHDFNNLLTVILGNTELCLLEGMDGASRARIEEIHLATLKASELVRHLLAFGRAKPVTPTVVDLAETLRISARLMPGVLGPEIRLRLDVGDGPAWVVADEGELERAFLNLASNAREAMPQGGHFDVRLRRIRRDEATPRRFFEVLFKDTGVGMAAEVQAHIFEPYFTTRGAGNGLGLTQVYGVVKRAGGEVEVNSAPGAGAEFRLFFPEAPQGGLVKPAPVAAGTAVGAGAGASILLVDDDPAVRRYAAETLTRMGYGVLEACHGEDALAIWRESRYYRQAPDLILSDVVMPRMSGIQLAEAVAAEDPSQRVALMSGYYDDEKVRHVELRWPVLKKPFSLEALKSFLEAALAAGTP